MRIEDIKNTKHLMYHKALELYRISFPYHEQRETISQEKILNDDEYHFGLIYDETIFVGLVLYWETDRFIYIEHLCILPEMRNRQYGQKALALLRQKKKVLILEIDPPVDELSVRRKGFYERCGFVSNPFHHIHPPYHRGNEGHALEIMTCPIKLQQIEYDRFYQYLQGRVMDKP